MCSETHKIYLFYSYCTLKIYSNIHCGTARIR